MSIYKQKEPEYKSYTLFIPDDKADNFFSRTFLGLADKVKILKQEGGFSVTLDFVTSPFEEMREYALSEIQNGLTGD